MKTLSKLLKTLGTTLIILLSLTTAQGQNQSKDLKKIADSGNKPNWVNWSRGKDFKSLGKGRASKLKLEKEDEVYLFVAYAQEIANNGKTDLFSLDDTKRVATLNASFEIASILKQEIDASISRDVTITPEAREDLFQRTEKMKTSAKFSGFTRVGSYWEKNLDKANDKTYWDVYFLYSINKDILIQNLEKVMNQLDLPDKTSSVLAAIETAAAEADDADIGEF